MSPSPVPLGAWARLKPRRQCIAGCDARAGGAAAVGDLDSPDAGSKHCRMGQVPCALIGITPSGLAGRAYRAAPFHPPATPTSTIPFGSGAVNEQGAVLPRHVINLHAERPE